WTAPLWAVLPEDVATPVFHRGFVEEMIFWGRAGAEAFIVHADALFCLTPLRALRFFPVGGHEYGSALGLNVQPKMIVERLRYHHLKELLESPPLEQIHLLDLSGSTVSNPDGGPDIVVSNWFGDREAALLADTPALSGLKTLLLRDNVIRDRGAALLAESPW